MFFKDVGVLGLPVGRVCRKSGAPLSFAILGFTGGYVLGFDGFGYMDGKATLSAIVFTAQLALMEFFKASTSNT
jgi:hypothetical protein